MILNTGSRTDIPAFYSEWFMNRIRAGFVMARNPFYPKQIIRYDLDPSVVDVLVFCTKNPKNMLEHLEELKKYRMYWNVTITPYGKDIEPNVPHKKEVMDAFIELSKKVSVKNVVWRYDPIFLNEKYDISHHLMIFEKMCAYLEGYCKHVIISFIDLYEKTKKNFPEVKEVSFDEQCYITKQFVKIAARHGMDIRLCHEDERLAFYGADVTGCLSKEVLEEAIGEHLIVPTSSKSREGCNCLLGNDIGAYNSCLHLCRYCYANYNSDTVKRNMAKHDPASPLLIGHLSPDDQVHEAMQESWKDYQMSMI